MECKVNKDKIKEGIIEAATTMLNDTGLFTISGNKAIAVNQTYPDLEIPALTEDQLKKIEESKQYADEVVPYLRQIFLDNPAEFLQFIAEQAHGSESEAAGALNNAGLKLYKQAMFIFPDAKPQTPPESNEDKVIAEINKQFKVNVIDKTGPNEWTIHAPNELIVNYIMSQPGTQDMIMEELNAHYLSQYSSTSLNLVNENLWLNHPSLLNPSIQDLINFAKKINPNFRIVVTDNLDVNAVSLIRDNIIFIRQGSIISELPEEIAHFFFELLPDEHPLKVKMMERIIDFPIYTQTYNEYKDNKAYQRNGVPDVNKIKREASAKLIGEYVKAAYRNEADDKYGKKRSWLRDIVKQFFKFLRRAFHLHSAPIYSEPEFDITSPFREAAASITQGDISQLNLQKQPSIYDSIFFSQVEDELEEGYEGSDIAKSLFEFSRSLKAQVVKTFFKYSKEENMAALMEFLQDPTNKDYNKIFRVVERIRDAGLTLNDMRHSKQLDELTMLSNATSSLAEAYREMEDIPIAIEKVLKNMKKDKTEKQFLDNITELQMYFQFSDSFKKITDEFINLLGFIRTTYPEQTEGVNNIYDKMIEKMGSTEIRFRVVDEQIMSMLQDHVIALTHQWTDEAFRKYTGEINALHQSIDSHRLKNDIAKLLTQKITDVESIKQAVLGKFPTAEQLMAKNGDKVDIKRIKDMSHVDYAIFLFASPSLIADPFISTLMAHFTDRYVIGMIKGARDAKEFADKVLPTMKALSNSGVGWYEAMEPIQNVQKFYDYSLDDKTTEKRTFISATNRFDAQYENQLKQEEIRKLAKEIGDLKKEYQTSTDDARKAELKDTILPPKQKELKEKKDAYEKWQQDWWNRPFTPEFYQKQALIKENKSDSPALKKRKQLDQKILYLEHQQFVAIMADQTLNNSRYDSITEEIAKLQNEKLALRDQIPTTEKHVIEMLDDLYEVDEVNTSRLRQTHKEKLVGDYARAMSEIGTGKSKAEIQKEAGEKYDALYTIITPVQAFFDRRSQLFDEINKITRPVQGLEKLSDRMQQLRDKEKEILKSFRDLIRGEITVSSFKYLSLEKDKYGRDKLLSETLKELEEEADMIVKKMKVYSIVLTSPEVKEEDKARILSFVELSFAFHTVISNSLTYKAEDVKEVFKDLIPLTTSQAEQILSASKKAVAGDNSDFNNLANLQLGNVNVSVKSAYSILNFASPQNMIDAETSMYAAFKYLTRAKAHGVREAVDHLYMQLNAMYTDTVSLQYYLALQEFFYYYEEYVKQDFFNTEMKDLHSHKFNEIIGKGMRPSTVADIESMMGDGVFEAVLDYMKWKEQTATTAKEGYPLSDLATFLTSIHKQRVTFMEGQPVATWTPINYVKKPEPDPTLTEERSPRFLTRNRIKDKYRTQKVYETDQDVIDGNKEANVDINGEWLPLNKKDSPFWNEEYDRLKNAKDTNSQNQFKLLQQITQEYLQLQVNSLPEGERLDLVIPSKHVDKLEQKKLAISDIKAGWDYIRNATPFLSGKTLEEEKQNYLEDINAVTAKNRDIYTGAVIADKTPKMRSRRRIPLVRTSKDALSSVVMFIEDINEYSAKNMVAPIMKSFADVFTYAHTHNPTANRFRKGALTDLYKTKILGEIPDNFFNNEKIAQVANIANKLTTFRLLGDPIGALVSLTSGTLQQLIDANFEAKELKMYAESGWIAKDWLYSYDRDFYRQSDWGLETQLIGAFNMLPDMMDFSTHLSTSALLANVRSKLMAPRTEAEKVMAIHLGLSIVLAEPIDHEGKVLTIRDIYELHPTTGLVRLKNEYKALEKEWNPIDGDKVVMLRKRLMQKYTLLQGNFFRQNQSFASTTAIGKSVELLKRWFASGVIRRYQGEVIDHFTGNPRKGYMLSIAHIIGALIKGMRTGDMQYIQEYFSKVMKRPTEKQAIRRALAEMLYTLVFGTLALFVLGYDDDDEDKNKKLREMAYMKQLMLLVTLRVQGELGTFIPVPLWGLGYMEMKRAVLDPIGLPKAAIDNIMALGALSVMHTLSAFGVDYDKALYYQKGKTAYSYSFGGVGAIKDKGDSKWFATLFNTIGYTGYTFEPAAYIQTLTQMQNRLK